eukprot:10027418-Lingulodinium_polyedra.AAC.1
MAPAEFVTHNSGGILREKRGGFLHGNAWTFGGHLANRMEQTPQRLGRGNLLPIIHPIACP